MGNKKIASLADIKAAVSEEAVGMAEELLEQVKRGEITSFCFAALKPGDDYLVGVGGLIQPFMMYGAANYLRDYVGELLYYFDEGAED